MLKALMGVTGVAGFFAVGGLAGSSASAAYFARRMVTPEAPVCDVTVRAVTGDTITLDADEQTRASGQYGLWFDAGRTHARVGEPINERDGMVVRVLEAVDFGTPVAGPARFNGYYFAGPPATTVGVDLEDVVIDGPLGSMPAWRTRAAAGDRWAILVHGRGAMRAECLRAVPTLDDLGYHTLIPAYRNDSDAPSSGDGLYHLGLDEWEDIEAAVLYAIEHGATDIVMGGWSMGGAIVLQLLDRSWLSPRVSRVFLDAPVIDWADVMAFHAAEHRLPRTVGQAAQSMMRSAWGLPLVGLDGRVDVRLTDWVRRADELSVPILLIHSRDDEFVPVGPSLRLAARRPDLVTMPKWGAARHCREWNLDPHRWQAHVRQFLAVAA